MKDDDLIGQWTDYPEKRNRNRFVIFNIENKIKRGKESFTDRALFINDSPKKSSEKSRYYCAEVQLSHPKSNRSRKVECSLKDVMVIGHFDAKFTHKESNGPKNKKVDLRIQRKKSKNKNKVSGLTGNIPEFGNVSLKRRVEEKTIVKGRVVGTMDVFKEELVSIQKDFKSQSAKNVPKSIPWLIYRGQKDQKRLRTSFHRTGKSDLIRYFDLEWGEVPVLARQINAYSSYKFDFQKDEDLSALLNLAQHHGFPTPLLDWTESPYIALFIAYEAIDEEELKKRDEKQQYVTIFAFNSAAWYEKRYKNHPPNYDFLDLRPKIEIRIPRVLENERPIPQQSVNIFTNVDDIEGFIKWHENKDGQKYLRRIDMPATLRMRNKIMKELESMGITRASLFPGIEGICKTLKQRYFIF